MPKILVIEDEKSVRANVVDLLTVEGFDVIGAENGRVGIQLAQEYPLDLIICDVLMPRMDGFEVLRELNQNPNTDAIPFIFLTAKSERSDMRQGMELGAYDYLTKPFTRVELLAAVDVQLKKREQVMKYYHDASERAERARQQLNDLQQFTDAKDQLLNNLVGELRNPLSSISMAIAMLQDDIPNTRRDRYLKILQEEFSREIALINQVTELQQLLTPGNIKLLRQFNLLQENSSKNP